LSPVVGVVEEEKSEVTIELRVDDFAFFGADSS